MTWPYKPHWTLDTMCVCGHPLIDHYRTRELPCAAALPGPRSCPCNKFIEAESPDYEYRLASMHKTQGGPDYSTVRPDQLALIATAVRRGMTHPCIAENWLERRAPGGEWEKIEYGESS